MLAVTLVTSRSSPPPSPLLVFPLTVLPIIYFGRRVRRLRAVSLGYAQLSDTTQEAFTGQRVVKAYNLGAEFGRRFAGHSGDICEPDDAGGPGNEIPLPWWSFLHP